ncbi:Alcohol dehydrogenase GroES-like domain-containing protein [Geodermatophilus amargosae]|uniref:Alcohol dehydrogenase GroES-like domain-containing protein n=1 Tax=Geodermatophilus amargosae TaxID=1296565 RepID=A0A1I6ZI74_9ACTN|nr:alcohol dehydrogenase catalytic domain-containing protein [Geodermatophilus amargosae]SFT62389.1 Alcohol dehydrogenase GroES-like domain-containing protein [Geodermatophilus amargosae]
MPDSMLAGRLNVRTKQFEVKEVPRPTPGPGQVLVEVRAAGICLSDVHLIDGQLNPLFLQGDEVTLGHEVAGVVAELGEGVTGAQAGARVTLQAGEEVDG